MWITALHFRAIKISQLSTAGLRVPTTKDLKMGVEVVKWVSTKASINEIANGNPVINSRNSNLLPPPRVPLSVFHSSAISILRYEKTQRTWNYVVFNNLWKLEFVVFTSKRDGKLGKQLLNCLLIQVNVQFDILKWNFQ